MSKILDKFPWDNGGESQDDATIARTSTSTSIQAITHKSSLQGILRNSSIVTNWPSRTASPKTADIGIPALWKCMLWLLIPFMGYSLSQLYPSSILLHFTFICIVYGLVDLMEHDPAFSIMPRSLMQIGNLLSQATIATIGDNIHTETETQQQHSSTTHAFFEHQRRRRVHFAKGTKFHRLPKPKSRRQRQDQKHELKMNVWADCRAIADSSTLTTSNTDKSSTTTLITTPNNVEPLPPTTFTDWESTNRLLRAIIIEQNPPRKPQRETMQRWDNCQVKSQPTLQNYDEGKQAAKPESAASDLDDNIENNNSITTLIPPKSTLCSHYGTSARSSSSCRLVTKSLATNNKVLQDHNR